MNTTPIDEFAIVDEFKPLFQQMKLAFSAGTTIQKPKHKLGLVGDVGYGVYNASKNFVRNIGDTYNAARKDAEGSRRFMQQQRMDGMDEVHDFYSPWMKAKMHMSNAGKWVGNVATDAFTPGAWAHYTAQGNAGTAAAMENVGRNARPKAMNAMKTMQGALTPAVKQGAHSSAIRLCSLLSSQTN